MVDPGGGRALDDGAPLGGEDGLLGHGRGQHDPVLLAVDEEVPGGGAGRVAVHAVAGAVGADKEPALVHALLLVAAKDGVGEVERERGRHRVEVGDAGQRLAEGRVEHVQRRGVGIDVAARVRVILGLDALRVLEERVQEDLNPSFPAHVHRAAAPALLHPLAPEHDPLASLYHAARKEGQLASGAAPHLWPKRVGVGDHLLRRSSPLKRRLPPRVGEIISGDLAGPGASGGIKLSHLGHALQVGRIHSALCARAGRA